MAYKAEMLMRDIPGEGVKQLHKVIMPSLVLKLQAESRGWEEFERGLLEAYDYI